MSKPNLNTEKGFTISVYFPPEAPAEDVEKMFDLIAQLVHGDTLKDRGCWDPFMVGHAGDLLGMERRSDHVYLSTGCQHGNHEYCQGKEGLVSPKTPACCKFCAAPCVCPCHAAKRAKESDNVDG